MTKAITILEIYITNLNLYNAGILFGEWVDMTAPAEEITEVISKVSRSGQDEIFSRSGAAVCCLMSDADIYMCCLLLSPALPIRAADQGRRSAV